MKVVQLSSAFFFSFSSLFYFLALMNSTIACMGYRRYPQALIVVVSEGSSAILFPDDTIYVSLYIHTLPSHVYLLYGVLFMAVETINTI